MATLLSRQRKKVTKYRMKVKLANYNTFFSQYVRITNQYLC